MLQYEIEGKIAVVTGCSATDTELEIPEYYEGNPVGKVKEGAFSGAARLRKISFPRTMRLIGAYAFSACKNLKEIFFSEGLETIEVENLGQLVSIEKCKIVGIKNLGLSEEIKKGIKGE